MAGKPHSDRAVAKMMAEHDVDKNGKLADIDEFVRIAWEQSSSLPAEQACGEAPPTSVPF